MVIQYEKQSCKFVNYYANHLLVWQSKTFLSFLNEHYRPTQFIAAELYLCQIIQCFIYFQFGFGLGLGWIKQACNDIGSTVLKLLWGQQAINRIIGSSSEWVLGLRVLLINWECWVTFKRVVKYLRMQYRPTSLHNTGWPRKSAFYVYWLQMITVQGWLYS